MEQCSQLPALLNFLSCAWCFLPTQRPRTVWSQTGWPKVLALLCDLGKNRTPLSLRVFTLKREIVESLPGNQMRSLSPDAAGRGHCLGWAGPEALRAGFADPSLGEGKRPTRGTWDQEGPLSPAGALSSDQVSIGRNWEDPLPSGLASTSQEPDTEP